MNNSIISFAYQNEINYFLDPTNKEIFRVNEHNNHTLYNDNTHKTSIRLSSSEYFNECLNHTENYQKMKKRLTEKNPNIQVEEEQRLIAETMNICNNNLDIFERFYAENNDLYSEIASKALKIKR